jgi:hypothetical protein
VATVEVGWQPLVLFGDSQVSQVSERLGTHLPGAFTHDRMYLDAWIAGNLVTTSGAAHTAGYLRYKSTTGGNGDLCEMSTPLFVFCGFGVNDMTAIGTTEANRNGRVAEIGQRYCEMLHDLHDRGIPTLIIGLPPYSDKNASEQEAKTIRHQLNPMLEGLALATRSAFVNPWHAIVSGSPEIAIPLANATYCDGLHYTSAGALLVATMAATAYETGIVGGWWAKGRRREARGKGSLWPI